ncbi:MAG: hypothetical protein ACI8R9_001930 [Paraglaciecola sp.]|jgi:hypothetical protein
MNTCLRASYSLKDECGLVGITGRCICVNKIGYIEHHQSPILKRLRLESQQWLTLTTEFEKHVCYAIGVDLMMNGLCHTHYKRLRGMGKVLL